MTAKMKSLIKPALCAITGLFNFIFMFISYCSLFMKYSSLGDSTSGSAYGILSLSDDSIINSLKELLTLSSKEVHGSFLYVLVYILILAMILLSALLLLIGVVTLLRDIGGIKVFNDDISTRLDQLQKPAMLAYLLSTVGSSFLFIIYCLSNTYSSYLLGSKVSFGIKPGAGMYLLLIFAIAEFIAFFLSDKIPVAPEAEAPVAQNISATDAPNANGAARFCDGCGNQLNENDTFCSVCGRPNSK